MLNQPIWSKTLTMRNEKAEEKSPHLEQNLIFQQLLRTEPKTRTHQQCQFIKISRCGFISCLLTTYYFPFATPQWWRHYSITSLRKHVRSEGVTQGQHGFTIRPNWRSRQHGGDICMRSWDPDWLEMDRNCEMGGHKVHNLTMFLKTMQTAQYRSITIRHWLNTREIMFSKLVITAKRTLTGWCRTCISLKGFFSQ